MLLYNSSNLNLGLRVTLIDQFSGPAARIKNAFKDLKEEKRLFEANARAGKDMYTGLATAGAAAVIGLGAAYHTGAKFEYSIRGVAAASEATAQQFDQLKKKANALGGTTMFTPTDIGGAMEMLAKAGYDANQVLEATGPIVNLAGAAMENLSTSADIAVSTMYQFNLAAKDMGYISDLLTQASLKSNVGLKDLGESLKYASATAVDLGQDLPTILSLIMTLGNAGMKGSMAGVGIENMFRYMSLGLGQFRKTGKSEAWEKAGLDPKALVDAKGNLKPIQDILGQLAQSLNKLGDVDKQNLLFQIFGVRGKRPPSKFLQDLSQIDKHMNSLASAGGKAEAMLNFMMEGPQGSWLKLLAAMESVANAFTEAMAPVVIPAMEILNKILTGLAWFMNSWIGGAVTRLLAIGLVVKTIHWGFKAAVFSVTLAISSIGSTILGVKNAYVASLNQMTAATMQLAGATTIVNRNRAAGVVGSAAAFLPAGAALRQATNGRYYKVGPRGARFVSTGVADRYMARYGSRTAGGYLASRAGMAAVGSRLLSFLGGPWGLAIITIATFLPAIIGGLKKNTEATEDSNQAIRDGANESRRLLTYMTNEFSGLKNTYIRKLYETSGIGSDNTDLLLANRLKEYMSNPSLFRGKQFYDYSHPDQVHIYMDGKLVQVIQRQINRNINTQLNFGL